jgi:hypothetical protein
MELSRRRLRRVDANQRFASMLFLIREQHRQLPAMGYFLGCSSPGYGEIEPALASIAWCEHLRTAHLVARVGDGGALGVLLSVHKQKVRAEASPLRT